MATAKTRPAELPNAFYTRQLAALVGWHVVGVVTDQAGEFFGLKLQAGHKAGANRKVLWLQSDDEGNGPGSFNLEEDNG